MVSNETQKTRVLHTTPFTFYANCHINFYAYMLLLFGLYFTLGRENFLGYTVVGVSTDVLRSTEKYLGCVCSI